MPPEALQTCAVEMDDGARILLRRYGRTGAPRLVGSHGNGFAIDAYWPFFSLLADRFELVLFDLRNHGRNPRHEQHAHHIARFVADFEILLPAIDMHFGRRPRAGLFHSVSSITALAHAIAHGWQWDAMVVVDPPLLPPPGHPKWAFAHAAELRLSKWAAARASRFSDPQALSKVLAGARGNRRWVAGAHERLARSVLRPAADGEGWELSCPGTFESQIYADNAEMDLSAGLAALPGPLLFACADPQADEAWAPALMNQALAPAHGHTYRHFPDTGHMLQLEQPQALADVVTDFLHSAGFGT